MTEVTSPIPTEKRVKISAPQYLVSKQEEERRLIKSYIAVLTSALGGTDLSSDEANPPYRLGDEAFACLKDIKKWLKSYDDERNTWEVAVACAESGLVINDLIVILCEWESGRLNKDAPAYKKNMNDKIALGCLELLVPLTWPLQLHEGMYSAQLQHYSNLKKHHVNYKKHILSYQGGRTLKAVARLALPIIATARHERTGRDNGILRLCTFFFRNILAIEPAAVTKATSKLLKPSDIAENIPAGVNVEDISLGTTLVAFEKNLVLQYLLTICGSINKDFDSQFLSTACLEMIYYLTKGVKASVAIEERKKNVPKPVGPAPSAATVSTTASTTNLGLSDLLSKESEMKMKFMSNGATRHGRFGTLLSLQTPDQGRLTLSGQQNLSIHQNTLAAFDEHKKWHKSQPFRYDSDENVIFSEISLSNQSNTILNKFINDFLDGAFNPLINAVAKELTSDSDNKPVSTKIQFLLIIAWFLEAERFRNGVKLNDIDYGLIVAGLNERTFILVFKYLTEGLDTKDWALEHSAIIAFKEIVTTTNFMGLSENQDDQDISTNIKERLFHKEHYLDLLARLPKEAYKHSPSYVNNCVDLVHIVLKTLEEFSKQDIVLFIKSKRKQMKSKNISKEQETIDDMDGSDEEAIQRTGRKLSKNRKFNFDKYQRAFVSPGTIETYITYLSRYEDLGEKDIKKGIQFLHRVFVTQRNHIILYRLDFMLLLHTLLSDEGLPKRANIRKHVSQFLAYYMKKLRHNLDLTPSLFIELLFPRVHQKDLTFFLETGEKYIDLKNIKKANNYAVIKNDEDMELETKVSIMVASLIDDDMRNLVEWVGEEMEKILITRIQKAQADVPPDQEPGDEELPPEPLKDMKIVTTEKSFMNALITNPKIRYLLDLANFDLPQRTGDDCAFRADADQFRLSETVTYIKMYLMQPVEFDNGKSANDFIKIKTVKSGIDFDDSDNDYGRDDSDDDDEFAFEVRGNKSNEGYNDDVLDQLEDAIEKADSSLPKGVAKAKNKKPSRESGRRRKSGSLSDSESEDERPRQRARKKRRNRGPALAYHDVSSDEDGESKKRAKLKEEAAIISSKYVNDSADESDDEEFFAREQRLREILTANNGILGPEQLQEFVSNTLKMASQKLDVPKSNKYVSDDENADDDTQLDGTPSVKEKESGPAEVKGSDDSDSDLDSENEKSQVLENDSDTGSLSDEFDSKSQSPLKSSTSQVIVDADLDDAVDDFDFGDSDKQDSDVELSDKEEATTVAPRRKPRVVFSDDDDE